MVKKTTTNCTGTKP